MKRFLLPVGLVGTLLLSGVSAQGPGSEPGLLKGTLSVEMYGAGAAPFGIASAILGSMSTAYNLGQLQQLEFEPRDLFGLDEKYFGDLEFTLRPKSRDEWELQELSFRYTFSDQTRFDYDEQARIWDSMSDAGDVRWVEGQWSGVAGWDPGFEPKMDLRLYRAPTAEDCQDREAFDLFRYAREILFDTSSWVSCYELQIRVAHPMQPTGTSRWESPITTVILEAADGKLRVRGEGGSLDPRKIPIPSNVPPEAAEALKRAQQMYDAIDQLMQSGLPTLEPEMDMTWDRTFQGPLRSRIADGDIYTILTGATVIEQLEVPIIDLVLEKTDPLWEPRSDFADGTPVEVRVRPRSPGSQPIPVRIRLSEVSREKGECLNDEQTDTYLDLVIDPDDNSSDFQAPQTKKDGWLIETKKPVTEATLKVRSWDYGPWAKVQAEGKFGSRWITLEVEGSDKSYTTIPLDEEGGENHIWDHWETSHGLTPGSDPLRDDDEEPVSFRAGDGLTLFEEYRGFKVAYEHTRLDPGTKDLFVHFQDGSGLETYADDIHEATGLDVHVIEKEEFVSPASRVVNPNRGRYSLIDQHGLYVIEWFNDGEYLKDGVAGQVECAGQQPGRPKDCSMVVIAVADAAIVVHEVLHDLDVWHHGDRDYENDLCGVGERIFDEREEQKCKELGGTLKSTWIANPQGQHSGDQRCVMAYDVAKVYRDSRYRLVESSDGALEPFQMPGVDSHHVCDATAGTHFNADGKQAGDARRGVCRTQLWVSDQ